MTTHERMTRMYEHRDADRVPITDGPWSSTLERWHREGLPEDVNWAEYFGLDHFAGVSADNGPQYPSEVIEETEEYTVSKSAWGTTQRSWKHAGGVPEFLDFRVKDRDTWAEAKSRMVPDRDRVDWKSLEQNYPKWRNDGRWIAAGLWFGFDVTHSWFIGTQQVLTAMIDDPEWLQDIFSHSLDVHIALFDQVWDAGYEFDEVGWCDDLGFKNNQFFSIGMYRDLLKPVHKRACDWAHSKGAKVRLHSCGDVRPFIPEFIEIGVDMLNPIEVKAGMDPVLLKGQYGDDIGFHGGINAVNFTDMDALEEEMRRVVPEMKKDGGYVLSSDHSVPDAVSLSDFTRFVELAKELGSYA